MFFGEFRKIGKNLVLHPLYMHFPPFPRILLLYEFQPFLSFSVSFEDRVDLGIQPLIPLTRSNPSLV